MGLMANETLQKKCGELEDTATATIQSEIQQGTRLQNKMNTVWVNCGNTSGVLIYVYLESPEEKRQKYILMIMAEKFPNLMNNPQIQTQEIWRKLYKDIS